MSPPRALRLATSGARATSLPTHRISQPAFAHQLRAASSGSNKSTGGKDDLGGPGGQEPADPQARAQQNASLRNKTILGVVLVGLPLLYYLSSKPQKAELKKMVEETTAGSAAR